MSNYVVSDSNLTAIADAIRTKGGTSAALAFPTGFADAIAAIPSGGGGASNFVTGTFKGTTSGTTMDVDLAYTGSGYPLVIAISPPDGLYGEFANVLSANGIGMYLGIKYRFVAPNYTGTAGVDSLCLFTMYKSSASSGVCTNYSTSGTTAYNNAAASSSGRDQVLKIKSSTKLSVRIASGSNGFIPNVEYTYRIIYSS